MYVFYIYFYITHTNMCVCVCINGAFIVTLRKILELYWLPKLCSLSFYFSNSLLQW